MEETTEVNRKRHKPHFRLKPAHIIVLGFLCVIAIGAILLCLPVSARSGKATRFIDALFTSASAVCVTGLATVNTGAHFSVFGQIVLMLLIQIGGLGFMSLTTMLMLLLRRKITLKNRLVIKEALGQEENRGLVRLSRNILFVTLGFEFVGFLLLLYPFVKANGGIGVWQAVFTSVSAFCNAGFDILGGSSLNSFVSSVTVNLSISFLVICGGLGFTVLMDIGKNRGNVRRLGTHSKIVLITTISLIVAGMLFYLGTEWSSRGAFGDLSAGDKFLAAFMQSVTTRTAGFATVDQNMLSPAGKFFTMLLMFIGASPGSTGGGIKTTTFTVLILLTVAGISKSEDITVGKRKVTTQNTRKAVSIFFAGFMVIIVSAVILLLSERGGAAEQAGLLSFENVLFECFSAFGTVGLSCGLTPLLSVGGKLVLILVMFFGRVGIVTIGLVFLQRNKERIGYPEANIMIG